MSVVLELAVSDGLPEAWLSAGAACCSLPAAEMSTVEALACGLLGSGPTLGPVSLRPRSPPCMAGPAMPSEAYADTFRLRGAREWRQIRASGSGWLMVCKSCV